MNLFFGLSMKTDFFKVTMNEHNRRGIPRRFINMFICLYILLIFTFQYDRSDKNEMIF